MTTVLRSSKVARSFIRGVSVETPAYLDDLGITWDCFISLRQAFRDYSGYAVRLRRSDNNAEADVAFRNGLVRPASEVVVTTVGTSGYSVGQVMPLSTFAGSVDLRIAIGYDQSGNGRNGAQATPANQPALYLAGVMQTDAGRPVIVNDQSVSELATTAFTRNQPQAVIAAMTNPGSGANGMSWTGTSVNQQYVQNYPAASAQMYAGTILTLPGIWWGLRRVYASLFNGATSQWWVNGEMVVQGNAGSTAAAGLKINGDLARWHEIGVVSGTTTDLAALSARLMAYWDV